MWPWEHLLLGYLLYSLYSRVRYGAPPTGAQALAAAVGSQLPDIIDKPLAWSFDVVDASYAIGHSVFVAPVILVSTYALARQLDRPRAWVAFGIAYLSHLGSDSVYPVVLGRGIEPRVVLWPLASPPSSHIGGGFVEHSLVYFDRFVGQLTAGELTPYIAFQIILAGSVILLWIADGVPVASDLYRRVVDRRVVD